MTIRQHGPLALSFLLLAASPAFSTSFIDPVPDDETVRRYDLRAALASGAPAPIGINMGLHVSISRIDNLEPSSYDVPLDSEPQLTEGDFEDLVDSAIQAADGAEYTNISTRGGWIEVTGNEIAQAAAAEVLASIEALMLDKVSVEIVRVPRPAGAQALDSLLTPEAFASALESYPSAARSKQLVRVGRRATFNDRKTTSYLYDYDVEVAQGAATGDPVVSILRTGVDFGIRVDRASDGQRFVVRAWGREGEHTTPMRRIALPSLANAELEFPEVECSIWTSSALLERGGAMVVDHGDDDLLLIRVNETRPGTTTERLSLGELALRPMRPDLIWLPRTEPSQGWSVDESYLALREAEWMGNMDGAEDVLETLLEGTGAEGLVHAAGSGLIAFGGQEAKGALNSAVADLAAATPYSTFDVDVRYAILDGPTTLEGDALQTFANAPTTKRLACTTMGNDAALLVHGTEAAYLQDFDVQIAAGAVIGDPIVKTTFTGASIWCSPMRTS